MSNATHFCTSLLSDQFSHCFLGKNLTTCEILNCVDEPLRVLTSVLSTNSSQEICRYRLHLEPSENVFLCDRTVLCIMSYDYESQFQTPDEENRIAPSQLIETISTYFVSKQDGVERAMEQMLAILIADRWFFFKLFTI